MYKLKIKHQVFCLVISFFLPQSFLGWTLFASLTLSCTVAEIPDSTSCYGKMFFNHDWLQFHRRLRNTTASFMMCFACSLVPEWPDRELWSGQRFWCIEGECVRAWRTPWPVPVWRTQGWWWGAIFIAHTFSTHINKSRRCHVSVTLFSHQYIFRFFWKSSWIWVSINFSSFVRNSLTSMCLSPFNTHLLLVSVASYLTGDDRNIIEVFVAGKKVVPFTESISWINLFSNSSRLITALQN